MLETVKEELLNSLKEIEDKDECQLGKMAAHIKNPKETAGIIRWYEEMLNTKKAKFINIVAKLLKQFTKSEEFFEKTGLNSSSSYFNINLYKSLLKYLLLKTSCLPFHYFKNNFKKIKVCKLNGSFLKKKKKKKLLNSATNVF